MTVTGASTASELVLDCDELGTRQVNEALGAVVDGARVRIRSPRGRHNLAVGLRSDIFVAVDGDAGYYLAGLCSSPGGGLEVEVHGSVGWSVAENLMSGTIRVRGNASQSAGASAHGGLLVVHGDASLRAGISLKGATIAVAGDVGPMAAFMAQAGTMLVGGNAGSALGDSLYEAVVYVAGTIESLGADARVEDLSEVDVAAVEALAVRAGFDHIDAENVKRVSSARQLYHFDSMNHGTY